MPDNTPIDVSKLSVQAGWLVIDVGRHTCGAGDEYGHEPDCGLEPIVDLSKVDMQLLSSLDQHESVCNEDGETVDTSLGARLRVTPMLIGHRDKVALRLSMTDRLHDKREAEVLLTRDERLTLATLLLTTAEVGEWEAPF